MEMNLTIGDVLIRELNATDTDGFLSLKQLGLATDPDSFVSSREDDDPSYAEQVRHRLTYASIEAGDAILGAFSPGLIGIVAVTRDHRLKRRHKADLHGMYVVPKFRGRGLGKRLLQQVLAMAREMKGLEEVQLIVAAHNHEAVTLYERASFKLVCTERQALKRNDDYVDAHHMILECSGRGVTQLE